MEEKKKNTPIIAGVVFTGCMFIGLGLGILYSEVVIGIMLGMGAGFLAMGAIYAYRKEK